jgi:hypothetical protein
VVSGFPILSGLRAGGPFPQWREPLMLFGQFVGVWDINVEYYNQDGERRYHGRWEWSFAWILDGRAIQDVIAIVPDHNSLDPAGRATRSAGGTTVRYCDPATGLWTIYYLGVVSGITTVLRGGAVGDTIVLEGSDPDGTQNRWTFSDITPRSFTWTGLESAEGASWWRNQRMLATRIA